MILAATVTSLNTCSPVPVQQMNPEEKLSRERYQARILLDPHDPQNLSGFLRLSRVSSESTTLAASLVRIGNPQDLDAIIDAMNEFTPIKTSFAPSITYSDPRLYDLPVIIPQTPPTEVELAQITRYLMAGGFIIDLDVGFDVYREGLQKYGRLVWGSDAWTERIEKDHPLFRSFFVIKGGVPHSDPGSAVRVGRQRLKGLYIRDRLVGVEFGLGRRNVSGNDPTGSFREEQMEESGTGVSDAFASELGRMRDLRRQQMAVNVIVYALTRDWSIARRSEPSLGDSSTIGDQ
ncbi:MAG: DUF4159 domain-containing protein [Candidatus Latescibacterota bacterium]|nr:DUF4159 domain-containing protein [Candidatus Latescibacterota bacterium]